MQHFKFCTWKYPLNILKCTVRLHNAVLGRCPAVCYAASCSTSHYGIWLLLNGVLEITVQFVYSDCSEKSVKFEFYFDYGLETKGDCIWQKVVTPNGNWTFPIFPGIHNAQL